MTRRLKARGSQLRRVIIAFTLGASAYMGVHQFGYADNCLQQATATAGSAAHLLRNASKQNSNRTVHPNSVRMPYLHLQRSQTQNGCFQQPATSVDFEVVSSLLSVPSFMTSSQLLASACIIRVLLSCSHVNCLYHWCLDIAGLVSQDEDSSRYPMTVTSGASNKMSNTFSYFNKIHKCDRWTLCHGIGPLMHCIIQQK